MPRPAQQPPSTQMAVNVHARGSGGYAEMAGNLSFLGPCGVFSSDNSFGRVPRGVEQQIAVPA